jgi:hypothetical protein
MRKSACCLLLAAVLVACVHHPPAGVECPATEKLDRQPPAQDPPGCPPEDGDPPTAHTASDWQRVAESCLPPESNVLDRTIRMTAIYADWYLRHPELKWSGLASLVTMRMWIAMQCHLSDLQNAKASLEHPPEKMLQATTPPSDLKELRDAGNLVYERLAWAHVAYLAGGIDAVRAAVASEPSPDAKTVLGAFEQIHQGDAWSGNTSLLELEQRHVLQPMYGRLTKDTRVTMSVFATAEFGDPWWWAWGSRSIFQRYMWGPGLPVLIATGSRPDIGNDTQRWFWLSRRVFPLWKNLEQSHDAIPVRLKALQHSVLPDL